MSQTGDVLIINNPEEPGGVEFGIEIVNGTMIMTGDFDTAVKLSLWGGNEQDDGSAESAEGWWGNLLENEEQFKMVSRTQHLLRSLPLTSASLRQIEEAVAADLGWFLTSGIASSIENIRATLPAPNHVRITGDIKAVGAQSAFSFVENWQSGVSAAPGIVAPTPVAPVTGVSVVFDDTNSIRGAADQDLGLGNVFTLMMWVKPDLTAGNRIFEILEFAGGDVDRISLRINDSDSTGLFDAVIVRLSSLTVSAFKAWKWDSVIGADEWSHVVATWDGTIINVYVNGVLATVTSKSSDLTGVVGTTQRVISLSEFESYEGQLHHAAAWSTVLTQTEIQRIYNAGVTGVDLSVDSVLYESSASLEHWYQLGLDSADIGKDYGNGTAHDLTVLTNLDANDITNDAPGVE